MSRFLRRSFFQAVAAVVLFTGVSTSDLLAGTTHDLNAFTIGESSTLLVAKVYQQVFIFPMTTYVQIEQNNSFLPISVPIDSYTPLPPPMTNMYNWIYKGTATGLTPGLSYKAILYTQTGVAPNPVTYTQFGSAIGWSQQ